VPEGEAAAPDAGIVRRLRAAGCVFAEDEARLLASAAPDAAVLARLVDLRVAGAPLEQVVGWAAFCGLRIVVAPGVFVPRRRTGLMVREAAALARPGAVVVDLCCGTGAVGAALAAAVPGIDLHAADLDPAAVACARRNLPGVPVHAGDLFAALPEELAGRIAVLTANVPYVPTSAIALMPPEARDHEPRQALDGGVDGLALVRRVVTDAPRWLAPGGALLFECGEGQAAAALDVVAAGGLLARVATDEDLGGTVVVGTRG
jgi:release factor glutamine methyltransferase